MSVVMSNDYKFSLEQTRRIAFFENDAGYTSWVAMDKALPGLDENNPRIKTEHLVEFRPNVGSSVTYSFPSKLEANAAFGKNVRHLASIHENEPKMFRNWEGKMVAAPNDLPKVIFTAGDNAEIVLSMMPGDASTQRYRVRYMLEVKDCADYLAAVTRYTEAIQHYLLGLQYH